MDLVLSRRKRKTSERKAFSGIGMSAKNMLDGKWVKTIVLTFPKRLAREEATSMDTAVAMLVAEKIEPSVPSSRLNFQRKK